MNSSIFHFFEGFSHGFVFSAPFSVPILICLGRLLLEGFFAGFFAVLGSVVGYFCFFGFLLNGTGLTRNLVAFWYTAEPFLAFLGFLLCFKIATDFMSGNRRQSLSIRGGSGNANFWAATSVNFLFSFLLMFLNPAMNSTATRVLLSAGGFFDSVDFFSFSYLAFFSGTVFLFVLVIWPFFLILSIAKGNLADRFGRFLSLTEGLSVFGKVDQNSVQMFSEARPFVSFLLIGCLMSGGFQYSWRLFTQYPASFIDRQGQTAWVREFPSFDSNIQHRDKNLPLDRHLPVDKMNSRRVLSGRPPLTEQQKADASLKFQSFFLNALEERLENQILKSRSKIRDIADQKSFVENQSGTQLTDFLFMLKSQGYSFSFFDFGLTDSDNRFAPRPLENNTKGKPKYSYIRSYQVNTAKDIGLKDVLHDQLQVYSALFSKND